MKYINARMSPISAYLKYYIEAHRTENKLISITDLMSSNMELPFFFSDMTFITNDPLDKVGISEDLMKGWSKQLHLYKSRKQLIGSALAYKTPNKKVIPIFIFPCRIYKTVSEHRLVSEFGSSHINPAFLNEMRKVVSSDLLLRLEETLADMEHIAVRELMWLESFIEKNIPAANSSLDMTLKVSEKSYFSKKSQSTFFNQVSVGLIARSSTTASLLHDFDMLIRSNNFSKPIQMLFGKQQMKSTNENLKLLKGLPLSEAQRNICAKSIQEYLSVVIGPPGTGKSFTMSALAIQLVENGYSVLISSKTNQAVDIVYDMLQTEWTAENYSLRPGLGKYRKQFKNEIKRISNAARKSQKAPSLTHDLKKAGKDLEKYNRHIQKQIADEIGLSNYLREGSSNILMEWWAEYKLYRREKSVNTLSEAHGRLDYFRGILLNLELRNIESRQLSLIRSKYSRMINVTDSFKASISSRSLNWRAKLKSQLNYIELFKYYPLWLCKGNEVGYFFPHKKELFDFVLIDEASQMDIATSLPLMQRGKHVICFGDHMQLRHVSFLSKKKEEEIALSHFRTIPSDLVPYRSNSTLDIVEDRLSNNEDLHLLDEHYRSLPSLIQFSNYFYYNKCLKMMRSDYLGRMAITFHKLLGLRNKKGVNLLEAKFVVDRIKERLELKKEQTVGVISPFRNQVDCITTMCSSSFSLEEMESIQLRIDTPYGFQGDERDVVYISLALDDKSKNQSLQYLQSPGVWNVCITRAKQEQHILHSFDQKSLPESHIVSDYFSFEHQTFPTSNEYSDFFLDEMRSYLASLGITDISVNRDLGAVQLDISFTYKADTYVIDLVGFPGEQEEGLSSEDQALLLRMNIKLIVVLYSEWVRRPEKVKSEILSILE